MRGTPPPQGLYDGQHEHDACGVAFVATLHGVPTHDIVVKPLTALRNLDHRGASGAEVDSGDGAGILLQIPDGCSARRATSRSRRGAGTRSESASSRRMPRRPRRSGGGSERSRPRRDWLSSAGGPYLSTRRMLGATARSVMPTFAQVFVARRSVASRRGRAGAPVASGHGAGATAYCAAQPGRA